MGGSCVWKPEYGKKYPGFTAAKNGKTDQCHCKVCGKDISIRYKGQKDIETHLKANKHKEKCKTVASVQTLPSYFDGKKILLHSIHLTANDI